MINLFPNDEDFAVAERALDDGEDSYISSNYFQHYVALVAVCVRRGHRQVADIVARLSPIVGAKNAVHIPWLIEILSGPACDVHLWDWDGDEPGGRFYGPSLDLKDELHSPQPINA
ncbi:hypothetical protein [Sphingopyxis sp. JAI108]|uniref:hypothetical protein n=1 Tax=Sphingopyxis sp. JAI108 TaxID=2723060 RepID=UPI0015CB73F0|nr:hypothetical protein [Sphingopyxis sp. JAI108]NYF33804.1 hypothetical protein [Sphingopyxis sp. JAI108]